MLEPSLEELGLVTVERVGGVGPWVD